jgi:PIN domain nuclease of toxin-antitoxin system
LILLDTVTLVWFTLGDRRLGSRSRSLLEADNDFSISAITPWEVAMVVMSGRINLGKSPLAWIEGILADARMNLVPISPEIAVAAGLLPRTIHGDPADRLIMATGQKLACPILTPDEKLLAYAAQGHVQAIDARL